MSILLFFDGNVKKKATKRAQTRMRPFGGGIQADQKNAKKRIKTIKNAKKMIIFKFVAAIAATFSFFGAKVEEV